MSNPAVSGFAGGLAVRLGFVLVLVLVYSGLPQLLFPGFVLDDSYITYRYALNLVRHGSLAWNIGEDPVEGSTSFLWVLLTAPAVLLRIDPAVWSAGLSVVLMGWVMWSLAGRLVDLPWLDRSVIGGTLALSGSMALHATQGMETAAAAAALYGVTVSAHRICGGARSWRRFLALAGLMLLATLLRPEAAIFSAILSLALAAELLRTGRGAVLAMAIGFAPVVALGAAYFAWRYSYFGYLLPNPAYIKSGGLSSAGMLMVRDFLLWMVVPVLLFTIYRARAALTPPVLRPLLPVLLAMAGLLAYQFTVRPIQGYEFRYQAPLFPAILYVLATLLGAARHRLHPLPGRAVSVLVAVILLALPLSRFHFARIQAEIRTASDRIAAARALKGVEGAAMFTTEAGALPYYSQWRAYDHLGLTSEAVVHDGLSCALFDGWSVDLVVLLNNRPLTPEGYAVPLGCPSMAAFTAVAAIRKHADRFHLYLVRRTAPRAAEIARRLQTIDGVTYLSPATVLPQGVFDIDPGAPGG